MIPNAVAPAARSAVYGEATRDSEADFFREHGYLVKRGLVPRAGIAEAVDLAWALLPASFERSDPTSWQGPVEDESGPRTIEERKGRVKLRAESLRRNPALLAMLPCNLAVLGEVQRLAGGRRFAIPEKVRGIYATFPAAAGSVVYGHVDLHDYWVGAIAYLEDVPPGGGELVVWPGSHRTTSIPIDRLQRVDWPGAVGLPGRAGDVIFYHRRLVHSPGRNRRRIVRWALLCDFGALGGKLP
jgi:phytanoyl-CoA dioxygenase PhyH